MTQTVNMFFFFFSSRRRHTRFSRDWSSDVCSSDLEHVMTTRKGELSVKVREHVLLSKALRPLPKWHGLSDVDTRYRQRYADLIVNDRAREVFEVRFAALTAIREFLVARGYVEVEGPVLHEQAGGAT